MNNEQERKLRVALSIISGRCKNPGPVELELLECSWRPGYGSPLGDELLYCAEDMVVNIFKEAFKESMP